MTLTNFDPASLITRRQTVHPLSRLESFVSDMASTCIELEEMIIDDAFRTEDAACLRQADVIVQQLDAMIDALMAFRQEYVG